VFEIFELKVSCCKIFILFFLQQFLLVFIFFKNFPTDFVVFLFFLKFYNKFVLRVGNKKTPNWVRSFVVKQGMIVNPRYRVT